MIPNRRIPYVVLKDREANYWTEIKRLHERIRVLEQALTEMRAMCADAARRDIPPEAIIVAMVNSVLPIRSGDDG